MPSSTSGVIDPGSLNGLTKPAGDASLHSVCQKIGDQVYAFLETEAPTKLLAAVQEQVRVALGVISTALEQYGIDHLLLSYNGGKDCLLLLILLLAALSRTPPSSTQLPAHLPTIYIIPPQPFPAVTSFVAHTAAQYQLDLVRYEIPMKQAFEAHLARNPHVKAVLVGTRRTDPHGAVLTHCDPTDGGWPAFMRVHPVIDWHYREVWSFIRHLEIPYCELYDHGYTSLGGLSDTHPNPALRIRDAANGRDDASPRFRPAYELEEDREERLGRDR